MSTILNRLSDMAFTRMFKRSVVGEFDGIPLVSLRSHSSNYVQCIRTSLRLIRDYDPRRFRRVVEQTRWLVDSSLAGGAYSGDYLHRIKTTRLDFEYDEAVGDHFFHAAYFAKVVVHEATHGLIIDRGVDTRPENRLQIERICRVEENRFIAVLRRSFPTLSADLIRPFNPGDWEEAWNDGPFKIFTRELKRMKQKSKEND